MGECSQILGYAVGDSNGQWYVHSRLTYSIGVTVYGIVNWNIIWYRK
jgi:hypothetical protein